MKLLFSLAVAVCLCAVEALPRPDGPSSEYGPPAAGGGGEGYGSGKPGEGEDALSEDANYKFEYEVKDAETKNDFGHMESRMGDVAMGSYHVLLPDGRMQKVEYVADKDGYRPTITYEGEVIGYGPDVGGGKAGGGGGAAAGGGYRYRR